MRKQEEEEGEQVVERNTNGQMYVRSLGTETNKKKWKGVGKQEGKPIKFMLKVLRSGRKRKGREAYGRLRRTCARRLVGSRRGPPLAKMSSGVLPLEDSKREGREGGRKRTVMIIILEMIVGKKCESYEQRKRERQRDDERARKMSNRLQQRGEGEGRLLCAYVRAVAKRYTHL